MKMNLAQMQVIQNTINVCEQNYLPVFKYNEKLMSADFLPKESININLESLQNFYRSFSFEALDNSSAFATGPVEKHSLVTQNYSIFQSRSFVLDYGYNHLIKDKLVFFMFLEGVAKKFKNNPIPTSFITNVQYLDQSISNEVDFLRLDDNPEFEFISLISKN